MTDHAGINARLFDAALAFDEILYLASVLADPDNLPDALEEVLDAVLYGTPNPPPGLEFLSHGELSADDAAMLLMDRRKYGFLVQVSTPIPTYVTETTISQSRGYCRVSWFYAEELESVVDQAVAWRQAIEAEALAEFRAETTGEAAR